MSDAKASSSRPGELDPTVVALIIDLRERGFGDITIGQLVDRIHWLRDGNPPLGPLDWLLKHAARDVARHG